MKLFFLLLISHVVVAQSQYTLDALIQRAVEAHPAIKGADAELKQQEALKRASVELPKTEIALMYGQYNSIVNNDNNLTITQTLPFPTLWASQRALYRESAQASQLKSDATKNDIIYQVKQLHQLWLFNSSRHMLMLKQDSLYASLLNAVTVRYRVGEGTLLEKTAVETQYYEIRNALKQSEAAISNALVQMQLLLRLSEPISIAGLFAALPVSEALSRTLPKQNPVLKFRKQQSVVAMHQKKVESNRMMPDITLGYFTQTLIGPQTVDRQERYFDGGKRFDGFIIGLAVPLWPVSYTAKVKAAEYNRRAIEYDVQSYQIELEQQQTYALQELDKNKNTLAYYENSALPNATLLEQQSSKAFTNGEIDYATFLLNLRQALTIRQNYLQALYDFNQSVIRLEYLNGNAHQ